MRTKAPRPAARRPLAGRPPGRAGAWQASRRDHAALLIVPVVALALRLAYVWGQAQHNPVTELTMDPRVHHEWAVQIATGRAPPGVPDVLTGKAYFRAPLYSHLLGVVYFLFGPNVLLARILNCLLGSLSCYLIARCGLLLGGLRVGLLAGLLAAVYWPLIYFDRELVSVSLELALNTGSLLALLIAQRRPSYAPLAFAGLFLGLSIITRPTVITLVPAIALWLWWTTQGARRWRSWLTRCALFIGACALPIVPVTLRNYAVGGEAVLVATNGGVNFFIGNNPASDGFGAVVPGTRPDWWGGYLDANRIAERDRGRALRPGEVSQYWYERARSWIRSDPVAWLRLTLLKARMFWYSVELPNNQPIWFNVRWAPVASVFWLGFAPIAVLAAAALTVLRREWRGWSLLILLVLVLWCTTTAFFVSGRFRAPVVPLLILLAAGGIVAWLDWLRRRAPRLNATWVARVLAYPLVLGASAAALALNPGREQRRTLALAEEAEWHYNLGVHSMSQQDGPDLPRAIEQLERVVSLRPWDLLTHLELAGLYRRVGRADDVIAVLQRALERQPERVDVRRELAVALRRAERIPEAIREYQRCLEAQPDDVSLLATVGALLAESRRLDEAIDVFRRHIALAPQAGPVRLNLAKALRQRRNYAEALSELERAAQVDRNDPRIISLQAWILASAPDAALRDGPRALRLAEQARERGEQVPEVMDTLAAAYAELGRFHEAVAFARRARELAASNRQPRLVAEIDQRISLYERGEPYRDPSPVDLSPADR
jgi:tetratricopeptide (TPR) repeat protein